ncbi:pseudouridine synthase [Reinekea marinisedimentorum]|uniref:tRNA pseudouridine synthase C n=1 Tax=Reinekea marinisedimentorum TaxID=230495 RepID=A0A4R3I7W0_9GAMM|nr:pseudouridine synthase [Reinekea marinisedimentorum]TCS41911.1 tRNA pseudouridine65 synthase [Reinekea marinisedimentorum]
MSAPLNILYEDEYLLAVDKPAGLLLHPSWLDKHETDTLASRVKSYFLAQGHAGKVHTVHRLDRPTSGVVLIAKDDEVARNLATQFRTEQVRKTYWAICRGFCPESQLIDYELTEELDKIADKHASKEREPQKAVTRVRRLAIAELGLAVSRYSKSRFSLVECTPETGRKHQIRRHLKHIRHPILGDTRYGCRHHNKLAKAGLALSSLALRAVSIEFFHPVENRRLKVSADLPLDWLSILERLGWQGLSSIA